MTPNHYYLPGNSSSLYCKYWGSGGLQPPVKDDRLNAPKEAEGLYFRRKCSFDSFLTEKNAILGSALAKIPQIGLKITPNAVGNILQ